MIDDYREACDCCGFKVILSCDHPECGESVVGESVEECGAEATAGGWLGLGSDGWLCAGHSISVGH